MLITMHRSGGFAAIPGLELKVSVDTGTLPAADAEELESAVRTARITELAALTAAPPAAGDRYVYDLTVKDGASTHAVTVTEPFADPAVDTLIEMLSARA